MREISQNKQAVIVCALLLSLWQIRFLFPALFSFPFVQTIKKIERFSITKPWKTLEEFQLSLQRGRLFLRLVMMESQ